MEKTARGFDITEFVDRYGVSCSLQKSSIATEDCIWFGANKIGLKIFIPNGNPSWRDITDEELKEKFGAEIVLANTRMHLTRRMVKELLPYLLRFAETGELKT